jgi:hypothetical protein
MAVWQGTESRATFAFLFMALVGHSCPPDFAFCFHAVYVQLRFHCMFRPNRPSSDAQVVVMRESAVYCNAVLLLPYIVASYYFWLCGLTSCFISVSLNCTCFLWFCWFVACGCIESCWGWSFMAVGHHGRCFIFTTLTASSNNHLTKLGLLISWRRKHFGTYLLDYKCHNPEEHNMNLQRVKVSDLLLHRTFCYQEKGHSEAARKDSPRELTAFLLWNFSLNLNSSSDMTWTCCRCDQVEMTFEHSLWNLWKEI